MANHHLKNKELTLKAKGLMSVMLSLPDNWDYTLKGLAYISREGVDAIREAVRELEQAGYIVRSRVRNEKGQLTVTEYVIYEQPRPPQVVTEAPVRDKPVLENPTLENPTQDKPMLENPVLDFPALDEPALENPTQLKKHRPNTHRENMDLSIPYAANTNPSIPYPSTCSQPGMVAQYRALVENHIDYEVMCQQFERDRVDEIVSIMVEALCSKALFFTISGEEYPAELVRERLLKINSVHIQYVFECLSRNTRPIRNIKAYLLATLFNASATCGNYYDARVRHDQCC